MKAFGDACDSPEKCWEAYRTMGCPYFAAADNFSALKETAKGVAEALAENVAVKDEEVFRICLGSPIWSLMGLMMIPLGLYLFLRPIQVLIAKTVHKKNTKGRTRKTKRLNPKQYTMDADTTVDNGAAASAAKELPSLYAHMPDEKVLSLEPTVNGKPASIAQIKAQIQKLAGIAPEEQHLKYNGEHISAEDESNAFLADFKVSKSTRARSHACSRSYTSLYTPCAHPATHMRAHAHAQVPNGATIYVNPKPGRIPIKLPGNRLVYLELDDSYTIESVKQEVRDAVACRLLRLLHVASCMLHVASCGTGGPQLEPENRRPDLLLQGRDPG
jgi:hypothetical protein